MIATAPTPPVKLTPPQVEMLGRISRGEYYLAGSKRGTVRAGRKHTLRTLQAAGYIAAPVAPSRLHTLTPAGQDVLRRHIDKITGATS